MVADVRNPFTPTFGVTPPLLVGRDLDVQRVVDSFDASVGDPYRAVKVLGLRGSGKTVFLNRIEDEARRRGWAVISETTRSGLAERLTSTVLPRLLADLDPDASSSTITKGSISTPVGGLGIDRAHQVRYHPVEDLRTQVTRLADLQDGQGAGLLITVDEINPSAVDDLRELTQVVQHCFREGRQVAFACAGLNIHVRELIDADGMTFLRRAEEVALGPIGVDDVRRGLVEPLRTWGRDIDAAAADVAAAGAKGYPFMIQAIGYRLWATAPADGVITIDLAEVAVAHATRRMGELVLRPELRALSKIDRSYLAAMAVDDGPSRTRDIAARLGVNPQYASAYRQRLISADLITEAGYGYVDFTLPTLRDYLIDHAVTETYGDTLAAADQAATLAATRHPGTADERRSPPDVLEPPSPPPRTP